MKTENQAQEEMIFPTLHMNGTGYRMLHQGYEEFRMALREAIGNFGRIEFNARDYYVQGPQAWDLAVKQMDTRRKKLADVFNEIEAIIENLYEQKQRRVGAPVTLPEEAEPEPITPFDKWFGTLPENTQRAIEQSSLIVLMRAAFEEGTKQVLADQADGFELIEKNLIETLNVLETVRKP